MGVMDSIYTELALYESTNECARTDTVFLPISEVCEGTVSLERLSILPDLVPLGAWGRKHTHTDIATNRLNQPIDRFSKKRSGEDQTLPEYLQLSLTSLNLFRSNPITLMYKHPSEWS